MNKAVPEDVSKISRTFTFQDCIEIEFTKEDISRGIEWPIQDDRHAVIVHLEGNITELDTEIDGCLFSPGTANIEEVWTVPAGCKYVGRALGEEVKYAVIRLPTDFMKRLYPSLPLVETMSSFQGFRDPFCYWVTQELISTIESDADADREMLTESALRSLSLHVYRNYGCKPNQSNSSLHFHSDTIRANALQEYVRSNLDRRIPVLELQAIAGATTEVFLDSFRKAFGTTPAQYVIEQRIRRAQWLLTHTETPITEIAFETGFSSHGHFSRSFKKRIGKSPRLYRDHQTVMAKKKLVTYASD